MKICPHCQAEVEEQFDLCWKCNYSFTEGKVAQIKDERECEIECLRCRIPMFYEGDFYFREGFWVETGKKFDIYVCPECGKIELFLTVEEMMRRKKLYDNLNK